MILPEPLKPSSVRARSLLGNHLDKALFPIVDVALDESSSDFLYVADHQDELLCPIGREIDSSPEERPRNQDA